MVKNSSYGGKVIGRALKEEGVECVFGIHGNINLAIEEVCNLGAKMYHFRHEQSAGFAADAYARCLRRPGVCFASAAPGFENYVSAINQAKGALSPVVLLIGQHGSSGDGLEMIQEGYGTEVFKSITKWTHRCLDWNLHSFWVRKALRDAMYYPPGPVVLEFPRNTLNAKGPDRQQKYIPKDQVPRIPKSQGDPVEIEKAVRLLLDADKPLLIAGDGVYWSDGSIELKGLAELLQTPVHSRRTCRGAVPEDHRLAFTGGYRQPLLNEADVICLVGIRSTYLEEWFELPDWSRKAKYIQIQERPEEIWCGLPTEVAVIGSCGPVLKQMIDCTKGLLRKPVRREAWLAKLKQARENFKNRQREIFERYTKADHIHPHFLGQTIADFLDPSATIIFDSFTGTGYLTDKLEAKFAGQILDAGVHQALGQGIGMCIGAQIAKPGKQVLTLMGDGGFGISALDMETLLRYKLPAVIVLLNNSSWGGASVGQNFFYSKMDSWDNTADVRYDKMFQELGCHTEYVREPQDLRPALERAFNSGMPSLINVVSEATELHPVRLRISFGDTWTRENVKELSEEALAQLKRASSLGALKRVQKFWIDNGLYIPLEELGQIIGVPREKLVDSE